MNVFDLDKAMIDEYALVKLEKLERSAK